MTNTDYIVVGEFLSVHGIKGWLTIRSYTHPIDNIFNYSLFIEQSNGFNRVDIEENKILPKKIIIKLKSIETINDAEKYINKKIFVLKENLPTTDKDEFYWHQLIDRVVYNEDNHKIGIVESIFSTKSNDIVVVKPISNNKNEVEILIPFIKDYILKVPEKEDIIIVRWNNDH
ncbi:MAG: ribosome maturation factor RimM [Pseudomonadota bacterium]|nr:ribosome maturation factor RimM [Pseudomonadota bacterium]|tara:strand:+ start:52 stop:570 length:519 start_codon:yes stop_codon:yes gene_type:complete